MYLFFAALYAISFPIVCAQKSFNLDLEIKTACNNYFEPLNTYNQSLARSKKYGLKVPQKEPIIEELEKSKGEREYLENFCKNFYKEKSKNAVEKNGLLEQFWNKKKIASILAFKAHYDSKKSTLDTIKNQFESIKFNNDSYNHHDSIIQDLITGEINPLETEYQDSYDFALNKVYEGDAIEYEDLSFSMDWIEICKNICIQFLKKTSGTRLDSMGPHFFDTILQTFTEHKNEAFADQGKPNSVLMQSFFQSIIDNNPVFSGCADFHKTLTDRHYPDNIKIALTGDFSTEATSYYKRRLQGSVETEPADQVSKIERNAMSRISIELHPLVRDKFKQKYPHNQAFESITEMIITTIFSGRIEYAHYPELSYVIDDIIEYLELPTNKEKIDELINIALCNTPATIKAQKKRLAKQSQMMIEQQEGFQKQLKENKKSCAALDEKIKTSLFIQQEIDERLVSLDNINIELKSREKEVSGQFTLLKNKEVESENKKKSLEKREQSLDSLYLKLTEQERELTKKENLLKEQARNLDKRSFPIKVLCTVTLLSLATFWFIVTMVRKYQFIH